MTRAEAMERALVRLSNEVNWVLWLDEAGLRQLVGDTPVNCLRMAALVVQEVLALPPDPDQSAEIARLQLQEAGSIATIQSLHRDIERLTVALDAWKVAALYDGPNGEEYRIAIENARALEEKP